MSKISVQTQSNPVVQMRFPREKREALDQLALKLGYTRKKNGNECPWIGGMIEAIADAYLSGRSLVNYGDMVISFNR